MKLLALDAATEACSVALYHDGDVTERFEIAPREHARLLLPMAYALLAESGCTLGHLDALAFGRGPGAFTGLRIAAGVVQGLALGSGLAVAAVSDLAALAAGTARVNGATRVLSVTDARMGEVYWCGFDNGAAIGPERVSMPTQLAGGNYDTDWHPAGNGWAAYPEILDRLAARLAGPVAAAHPRAADIARLAAPMAGRGELLAPEDALPSYVRDDVARKLTDNADRGGS